jgi:hypothetical protein
VFGEQAGHILRAAQRLTVGNFVLSAIICQLSGFRTH